MAAVPAAMQPVAVGPVVAGQRAHQTSQQTVQGTLQTAQQALQTAQETFKTAQGASQTAQVIQQTVQGTLQTAQGALQTGQGALQTGQGSVGSALNDSVEITGVEPPCGVDQLLVGPPLPSPLPSTTHTPHSPHTPPATSSAASSPLLFGSSEVGNGSPHTDLCPPPAAVEHRPGEHRAREATPLPSPQSAAHKRVDQNQPTQPRQLSTKSRGGRLPTGAEVTEHQAHSGIAGDGVEEGEGQAEDTDVTPPLSPCLGQPHQLSEGETERKERCHMTRDSRGRHSNQKPKTITPLQRKRKANTRMAGRRGTSGAALASAQLKVEQEEEEDGMSTENSQASQGAVRRPQAMSTKVGWTRDVALGMQCVIS